MKIRIKATEIQGGEIDFISLVRHAANRSAFKIVKTEEVQYTNFWAGLLPEVDRLDEWLANMNETLGMEKTVTKNDEAQQIQAREIASLRHRLAGLYSQQQNLWERPNTPAFQKFDDELTFSIEKTESELRLLTSDEEQMNRSSAFFRRGGSSVHSAAALYDSADDHRAAELRKAEDAIDLSPTITTTDEAEVERIDLSNLRF